MLLVSYKCLNELANIHRQMYYVAGLVFVMTGTSEALILYVW